MPDPTHRPRDDREENGPSRVVTFPRSRERPLDNLSLELTSFVGRAREVAEVKKLLAGHRLITLTGPGECGKTRLALAVASAAVGGFEDGAWWVELASLSDPVLVPQRVASALGVREGPGCPLTETLSDHLGSKKMLTVRSFFSRKMKCTPHLRGKSGPRRAEKDAFPPLCWRCFGWVGCVSSQ